MAGPLAGIRVLEVASWVAAPSAGVIMADLGADVIKIEPPTGDGMRGMLAQPRIEGPAAELDYPFQMDNRGKRSVAIALDRPEGAALARRLAARSDVLLTNLVPQRQKKYGLDAETLLAELPRIVHASVNGYGTQGPEAHRPGFDSTAFFSWSGLAGSVRSADEEPGHFRPAQGDHTTGLCLYGAIITALRMRDDTGESQVVEVSLLRTGVWTIATDYSAVLLDRQQPRVRERHEQVSALVNPYRCADSKWLQLMMPNSRDNWTRLCKAIEREDLVDDERFDRGRSRYRNMKTLVDLLDAVFASRSSAEWHHRLDAQDLIWAPIHDLVDAASDPQVRASGAITQIEHPIAGRFETVAAPFEIRGAEIRVRGHAPETGEHDNEVLAELDLPTNEIERLRQAGVIGALKR